MGDFSWLNDAALSKLSFRVGNLLRPRTLRDGAKWGNSTVKKVEEYLKHASECRTLARTAPPAHRQQLEDMAQTWEQLAGVRMREVQKHLRAKTRWGGIVQPPP